MAPSPPCSRLAGLDTLRALALARQYHPRAWTWLTRQGDLSALLGLAS